MRNEPQRNFEGFSNENTFQIRCSISIYHNAEVKERRNTLLETCQKRMVTMLAEFKIAYDYNFNKYLKFHLENQNITGNPPLISDVKQLQIVWEEDLIRQLKKFYRDYIPGRIVFEWLENDIQACIYTIQKPGLMNQIKNSPLPFGLEFH